MHKNENTNVDGLILNDAFDLQEIKRVWQSFYNMTISILLILPDNFVIYLSFAIIYGNPCSSYSPNFALKTVHNAILTTN